MSPQPGKSSRGAFLDVSLLRLLAGLGPSSSNKAVAASPAMSNSRQTSRRAAFITLGGATIGLGSLAFWCLVDLSDPGAATAPAPVAPASGAATTLPSGVALSRRDAAQRTGY